MTQCEEQSSTDAINIAEICGCSKLTQRIRKFLEQLARLSTTFFCHDPEPLPNLVHIYSL
ncbi:hypothetical protein NECAME_13526 [Necator americanus]|uniref:Uncharacterized protein n=1 Tax=Necator americanus TaxID=51031 RepID=W2SXV4_NECAM|nr:hypothetical protein NECAME_13526 [Necator americanus]ETN73437.1 hypothetical protein NECAME_13526 [Necator americanus]